MTTLSLEERVAALEAKIAQLTREQQGAGEPPAPWWEQRFGAFAESAEYEEALRLGREYREALQPPAKTNKADEAT
jgi:hypothetical protein